MKDLREKLFSMRDKKYKEFISKLIPNLDRNTIIGVRVPILRKISKNLDESYLNNLEFKYFEEKNLYMYVLSKINDEDEAFKRINSFLPFIDNWATCDIGITKVMKKNKQKLRENIKKWIFSENTYIIRYGLVALIDFFVKENFEKENIELLINIKNDNYYVNMAIAWYLSYCIIDNYDDIIEYFEKKLFSKFIHNKSIQKVIESNRVSKEFKLKIKKLKI